MVPTELIEELRGTWGPAPVDPERRVLWNEDLELLAQVPALLAKKVKDEGTPHTSLISRIVQVGNAGTDFVIVDGPN